MTRLAVVGATGAVGRTMLELLRERGFPADEIVAFATPRSAGTQLDGLTVQALTDESDLTGFDIALFSAGDDHTDEERKMMFETRKILEDESIGVAVTCVRVPVRISHSEAVNVQTREPIAIEEVRELLAGAPGVATSDDVPTPLKAAG